MEWWKHGILYSNHQNSMGRKLDIVKKMNFFAKFFFSKTLIAIILETKSDREILVEDSWRAENSLLETIFQIKIWK